MINAELKERITRWKNEDFDQQSLTMLDEWLASPVGEAELQIFDAFRTNLKFGTAGLRGVLGPGPNRMNLAVVAKTSYALGKVLLDKDMKDGVVVGFDARHRSKEFGMLTAGVLAAMGHKVYLFEAYAPTPLVAYALLQKQASAAVVVTASHNPPEYNGYKVYWNNGAQIISPVDEEIQNEIEACGAANEIDSIGSEALQSHPQVEVIDEIAADYIKAILELGLHAGANEAAALKIAYTPLHGVGADIMTKAFAQAGFEQVFNVAEQVQPDADFPTVKFPNPEEAGAMDLLLAEGKKHDCDLVIANDPDADRLAVAINTPEGFITLDGNQVGILLADHLLGLQAEKAGSQKQLVVTTVVSTSMLEKVAAHYNALVGTTLTGFKWIANQAMTLEKQEGANFVIGYEEALGYTIGTIVRDKDGISAALVFARMAARLKSQNKTPLDRLAELYRQFGFYFTWQRSINFTGSEGGARMAELMARARGLDFTSIEGWPLEWILDVQRQVLKYRDGRRRSVGLPAHPVLTFYLEAGHRITIRPSGTEPKLKIYYEVQIPFGAQDRFDTASERAMAVVKDLETVFNDLLGIEL